MQTLLETQLNSLAVAQKVVVVGKAYFNSLVIYLFPLLIRVTSALCTAASQRGLRPLALHREQSLMIRVTSSTPAFISVALTDRKARSLKRLPQGKQ